jgi:hypothetical protein
VRSSAGRRLRALVATALVALAGCTAGTVPSPPTTTSAAPAPSPTPTPAALPFRAVAPADPAVVVDVADPVGAALAVSRALYEAAPVAVLAAADDTAGQLTAASAAVVIGAPLLLTPPGASLVADGSSAPGAGEPALDIELTRLGTVAVLVVGPVAAPPGVVAVRVPSGADAAALGRATGVPFGSVVPVAAGGEAAAVSGLAHPGTTLLTTAVAALPGTTAAAGPLATQLSPASVAPAAVGTGAPASGPLAIQLSPGSAAPAAVDPSAPGTTGTSTSGTGAPGATTPGGTTPAPTGPSTAPAATLPRTSPAAPLDTTVALTGAGSVPLAVLATVRAAGVPLVDVPGADPRATSSAVQALARTRPAHVLALGTAFGPAERLAERVAAAATGVELPGGGQLYFPQDEALPGKRYVSIYGSPGMPSLGVLGEQDVPATIVRAQAHADPYRALTTDTVVPGVEIIATIASAGPGPDGNYSQERPVAELLPLVQAAGAAGMTVVLDLQPGRADFLTQAQEYEPLLELPNVSLALDPEWRLGPDQLPLRQIGHVGVDEVNAVAAWLAQLVRDHHLPQKALVLHEFALSMIDGRDRLDTSHDELALLIHVDGQGSQPAKVGTWNAIRQGAPAGIHWGWKNFYDEDKPAMLDPTGTYTIRPTPDLVTYQ